MHQNRIAHDTNADVIYYHTHAPVVAYLGTYAHFLIVQNFEYRVMLVSSARAQTT